MDYKEKYEQAMFRMNNMKANKVPEKIYLHPDIGEDFRRINILY